MTEAEHDCCMKMASTCESSAMPMSHSCCKHAVSHQVAALSKIWRGDTAVPAVLVSEIAPAFPLSLRLRDLYSSDSPPGSPPKLSTVLRIWSLLRRGRTARAQSCPRANSMLRKSC